MSNKNRAIMALRAMNNHFTSQAFYDYFAANDNSMTRKQATDLLNKIKHVKKHGNGKYSIKGRKVV